MSKEFNPYGKEELAKLISETFGSLKVKASTEDKEPVRKIDCGLIHSRVPKRTEKGIKWVCKEGCDER